MSGGRLVVDSATDTDPGSYAVNQDFVVAWSDGEIGADAWAVADGLGAHPHSEVAARVAAQAAVNAFREAPSVEAGALQAMVRAGHRAVLEQRRSDRSLDLMRTTLALLVRVGTRLGWAHVGDTRVYRFGGRLHADGSVSHTTDHSVAQELVEQGVLSPSSVRHQPARNRLTQALGQDEELKVAVGSLDLGDAGDLASLVCTDGWWEIVLDEEMAADLGASHTADDWLAAMRRRIEGRVEGRHDNFSAAAVLFRRT